MPIDMTQLLSQETLTQKPALTACFTGPRPAQLFGYNDRAPYNEIVSCITPILRELADNNVKTFISGGAQGIDQLAFWSVQHAKKTHPDIKNELYLPFQSQASRWSAYGMFGQSEYQMMLPRADGLRYISDVNPAPTDAGAAARMLHNRNHAMVHDADFVIAFMYGRSLDYANAKGGTAECIRYALSQQIPVLGIRYQDGPDKSTIIQYIQPQGDIQAQRPVNRPKQYNDRCGDMQLNGNNQTPGHEFIE